GGVDDMAALAMRADVRQEGGDPMDDAHQIDADRPIPLRRRDLVGGPAADADTGIVADHMHLAEGSKGLGCGALDRGAVGDVAEHALHRRSGRGELAPHRIERARLDIGEHHLHAGLCERVAQCETDAARAAGDEGALTSEVAHHAASLGASASKAASRSAPAGCAISCALIASRVCARLCSSVVTECQCTMPFQIGSMNALPGTSPPVSARKVKPLSSETAVWR